MDSTSEQLAFDFDSEKPKPQTIRKLARNLFQGEVIIIRGDNMEIIDHIEVLSKVISEQNGPKRVLVWSADDMHYTFGIDESVEIAHG